MTGAILKGVKSLSLNKYAFLNVVNTLKKAN